MSRFVRSSALPRSHRPQAGSSTAGHRSWRRLPLPRLPLRHNRALSSGDGGPPPTTPCLVAPLPCPTQGESCTSHKTPSVACALVAPSQSLSTAERTWQKGQPHAGGGSCLQLRKTWLKGSMVGCGRRHYLQNMQNARELCAARNEQRRPGSAAPVPQPPSNIAPSKGPCRTLLSPKQSRQGPRDQLSRPPGPLKVVHSQTRSSPQEPPLSQRSFGAFAPATASPCGQLARD